MQVGQFLFSLTVRETQKLSVYNPRLEIEMIEPGPGISSQIKYHKILMIAHDHYILPQLCQIVP